MSGPAVVRGDQHQDVVGGGLGVLDDHVEVAVLVEDPGVEELVLHLPLATAPVRGNQVVVGELPLRVLVLAPHVRVRRGAVQVEPVLLDVLPVVALPVGEAEHPLLEDRVRAVPQRQRQTQALALVADPRDAVLAPAVGARARLIVGSSPRRHRPGCSPPAPCPTDARSGTGPRPSKKPCPCAPPPAGGARASRLSHGLPPPPAVWTPPRHQATVPAPPRNRGVHSSAGQTRGRAPAVTAPADDPARGGAGA